jgi:hypothetical protein
MRLLELATHPRGHAALVLHDCGLERIEQLAARTDRRAV